MGATSSNNEGQCPGHREGEQMQRGARGRHWQATRRKPPHARVAGLERCRPTEAHRQSRETSDVGRALFFPTHDLVPVCRRQRYSTWIVLGIRGLVLGMCHLVIQSLELLRSSDHSRDKRNFCDRETVQRHVFVFVGPPLSKS
jgi:hypothetical protein